MSPINGRRPRLKKPPKMTPLGKPAKRWGCPPRAAVILLILVGLSYGAFLVAEHIFLALRT
jgi:hypothetical protein